MASSREPAASHLSPRRNPLSRLALLLGSVFALICLACCGGTWFIDQSSKKADYTDADSVAAVASEIAQLDLPPRFKAKRAQSIETMFEEVSAAIWESDGGSTILLAQVSDDFDLINSDTEQVLRKIPLAASLDRPPSYGSSGSVIDVEINGEKITFDLLDLAMFGMPGIRQTSGVFPTADGHTGVIFILTKQDGEATPDEIENILNSIR